MHNTFLKEAIEQAKKSYNEGGIPIGSVIVHNGKILGAGHNKRVQDGSVVLHGEMDALENAGRQKLLSIKNVLYIQHFLMVNGKLKNF